MMNSHAAIDTMQELVKNNADRINSVKPRTKAGIATATGKAAIPVVAGAMVPGLGHVLGGMFGVLADAVYGPGEGLVQSLKRSPTQALERSTARLKAKGTPPEYPMTPEAVLKPLEEGPSTGGAPPVVSTPPPGGPIGTEASARAAAAKLGPEVAEQVYPKAQAEAQAKNQPIYTPKAKVAETPKPVAEAEAPKAGAARKPGEVGSPVAPIAHRPVEGRGFKSYGYDPATQTLEVKHNVKPTKSSPGSKGGGGIYRHFPVTPEQAAEIHKAADLSDRIGYDKVKENSFITAGEAINKAKSSPGIKTEWYNPKTEKWEPPPGAARHGFQPRTAGPEEPQAHQTRTEKARGNEQRKVSGFSAEETEVGAGLEGKEPKPKEAPKEGLKEENASERGALNLGFFFDLHDRFTVDKAVRANAMKVAAKLHEAARYGGENEGLVGENAEEFNRLVNKSRERAAALEGKGEVAAEPETPRNPIQAREQREMAAGQRSAAKVGEQVREGEAGSKRYATVRTPTIDEINVPHGTAFNEGIAAKLERGTEAKKAALARQIIEAREKRAQAAMEAAKASKERVTLMDVPDRGVAMTGKIQPVENRSGMGLEGRQAILKQNWTEEQLRYMTPTESKLAVLHGPDENLPGVRDLKEKLRTRMVAKKLGGD